MNSGTTAPDGAVVAAARPLRDPMLAVVFAAALVACLPFMRYVYWFGDEGILLDGATRMISGEVLYRDVFAFLPPGGYLLLEGWMRVVGDSLLAVRAFAIAVVVLTACATYLACVAAGAGRTAAACLALGWVVTSQGNWTVVNHHAITTLLSMGAAFATVRVLGDSRPTRNAFVAGVLAGAAAMVTQSRGALTATACLLALLAARRPRGELIALIAGTAVVPLSAVAWLLAHGALGDAFQDIVVFTAQRYTSIQSVPFGHWADRQTWPLVALFPAIAVLVFVRLAVEARAFLGDPRTRAWLLFATAAFLGCFPRPDTTHIGFNAPLARLARAARLAIMSLLRRAAAVALAAVFLPSAVAFAGRARAVTFWLHPDPSPRGLVVLGGGTNPPAAAALIAEIRALPAGDRLFFYPYLPMLIFLTARAQTGPFDIFTPGYSLPEQYRKACEDAVARADHVVIDTTWSSPEWLKQVFPALANGSPPETVAFESALRANFALVHVFGPYEFRKREPNASGVACGGVTSG